MAKRLLFLNLILVLFVTAAKAGEDTTRVSQGDSVDICSAFSAGIKDYKIHLIWKITNPKDLSYFEVQRKDSRAAGYSSLNKDKPVLRNDFFDKYTDEKNAVVLKFNYEDDPETDGVYYYRLVAFDSKRQIIFQSDEIKIGISGIKDFKLEQNRPNPFNPTTSIEYELLKESHVTLKVYDLIGREITTLVDQTQQKGQYSVDFDASKYSNLTSGIYFYKLTTEKYTDVRKMILTK
jgi:hypothetical protein